jgi:uncharacterized membrane protein YphA (DoxX/SURF4 family)
MKDKIVKILSSLPIQVLCRIILGGVFIYASIDKILHPQAFAKIIHNYRLVPDILVTLPAIVLPWLEMISGLFLVAGIFRRASALVLSAMLLMFGTAITINLVRGITFDCGCFSTVTTTTGSDPLGLLVRDILLLIPGLVIIFFYKDKEKRILESPLPENP